MRWIYTDCRSGRRELLFETEATDVFEADRKLEESLGIKAVKQPLIAVYSPDWRLL